MWPSALPDLTQWVQDLLQLPPVSPGLPLVVKFKMHVLHGLLQLQYFVAEAIWCFTLFGFCQEEVHHTLVRGKSMH